MPPDFSPLLWFGLAAGLVIGLLLGLGLGALFFA